MQWYNRCYPSLRKMRHCEAMGVKCTTLRNSRQEISTVIAASPLVGLYPVQIGSKGLEIKVDNPESYNFRPKDMLRDICTTISQFSTQEGFHQALATSGYYQEDLLPKATATMRRLQLLPPADLAHMDQLCR